MFTQNNLLPVIFAIRFAQYSCSDNIAPYLIGQNFAG